MLGGEGQMSNNQLNTICFMYVLLNAEFCCIFWKSLLPFFTILYSLKCYFIIFICLLLFPFRGCIIASLINSWYTSHGIQIWGWWEKKKVMEAWWYWNSFKFWDTVKRWYFCPSQKSLNHGIKGLRIPFYFFSTCLVCTDVPDIIDMASMIHDSIAH